MRSKAESVLAGLALWLALFAASQYSTAAFDADKIYGYNFEGTVLSRLADESKPHVAGFALKAHLALKKTANDELTIKFGSPHFATLIGVADDVSELKLTYEPFESSTGLDKPFRVYLDESGSVKAFDSFKDEQKWVSNLKRGLLSFFQLKLQTQQQQQSGDNYFTVPEKSVFGECDTDYVVLTNANNNNNNGDGSQTSGYLNVTKTRNLAKCKTRFFHVLMPYEKDECVESDKDWNQYRQASAILTYSLTGSRDNYVIDKVVLDEKTSFTPFGQQNLSPTIQTNFVLDLDNSKAGVSDADMSVDTSSTIRVDSLAYEPPEMLNFYANVNLEDEHHLANIYGFQPSVEQVLISFNELADEFKRYSATFEPAGNENVHYQQTSTLGELYMRLSDLIGALSLQKLDQLYQKIDELSSDVHKKVFWDLMSVSGTNPSFIYMKKLITEGDAPASKIKDYLTRISFHIKAPSKALFDEYINLCKADKIQSSQSHRRLCSLPLASLIHQHCAKPHAKYLRMQQEGQNATAFKKAQNLCQIATAEEYFARLVVGSPASAASSASQSAASPSSGSSSSSGASNSGSSNSGSSGSSSSGDNEPMSTIGDKMFNIKMAAELGVRPTIDILMETVANKDEHPSLRAAAMWGLQKVARIYPSQVKKHVVPYYFDTSEYLEVRIAALYNWIMSGTSLHELETIASGLNSEPNRQLVLYLGSFFKSVADNMKLFPCLSSFAKNAKLIMPTIKKALQKHAPGSLTDSSASFTGQNMPDIGYGSMSLRSIILSNDSFAPANFYMAQGEIMSGLKLKPLEISIQTHGLDKLIKRIVGVNSLFADKASFMDVFSLKRRSKRQVEADQLIKQEVAEIEKELKLSTREFSDVYIGVTISFYGRPVVFFERDSTELKKMLSDDGTIKIPAIKKLLHSFNNHTSQQMMINFEKLDLLNNELGFPLMQQMNDFELKTFKLNSIKLDVEPGFFRDERQGKPPTKVTLNIDAKYGKNLEFFSSFNSLLMNTRQKAGAGFYKKKLINIPLKLGLDINLVDKKLFIKRSPINENILYIKQFPATHLKQFDEFQTASSANNSDNNKRQQKMCLKSLYDFDNESPSMKPFKHEFMTPLGIGIRAEGKHKASSDWSFAALRRYFGSIDWRTAMFNYQFSTTPMEVKVSTITTQINPTNELLEVFAWRHSGPNTEIAKDVDPVERDLEAETAKDKSMGKPTSVGYSLELLGGTEKQRKVSMDVHYSRSADRLYHKWRVFYQRTPLNLGSPSASASSSSSSFLSKASSEATNLCWFGSAKFPQYDIDKLLNFDILSMDHSANVTSELTFGDECAQGKLESAQSKVAAQLTFDWSPSQREAIKRALATSDPSATSIGQCGDSDKRLQPGYELSQLYKACLKAKETTKSRVHQTCLAALRKMTEMKHISANFDYKDVPERWVKMGSYLGWLYTYARAGYIDELDDDASGAGYGAGKAGQSGASGTGTDKAHLEANMTCPDENGQRKISYQFETPSFRVKYSNVPVNLPPLSTYPLLDSSYYRTIQRRQEDRLCTVEGDLVTTFDNFTYTLPQIGDGCLKLITKDCSPENNFAVLGAKVANGKLVKVYVAQKFKVEFVPDKNGKSVADIKINGESVPISDLSPNNNKSLLTRQTKLGPRAVDAFTIDYNGAYYTLSSKLYKFSVSTDGTWILVQQSKYYAGKSCGICGDANGESQFEFKAPSASKKICKTSADFVWAYVLPSTCASRPVNIECA